MNRGLINHGLINHGLINHGAVPAPAGCGHDLPRTGHGGFGARGQARGA